MITSEQLQQIAIEFGAEVAAKIAHVSVIIPCQDCPIVND